MDAGTVSLMVIAIFALIVVAAFLVYRQKIKTKITGPGGMGLEVEGSNEPTTAPLSGAGIEATNLEAKSGNVEVVTQRGKDIKADQVKAGQDISIRDEVVQSDTDPKGDPPE